MLQQTTVGAVGPYFQRFTARWPSVNHLAQASRDDILRMWAGLGYYRRAHLLHDCAQIICREHGGNFPRTEKELLALPGFGPYTAAAVAAIAFGERANVVDGNVERVMARIFAIRTPLPKGKAEIRAASATLLPAGRAGDYAQALMDLGATICVPRNPKCGLCPWSRACVARKLGIENELPARIAAGKKPVRRAVAFFATNKKGEILLRRRPRQGLLGGMMEIPSSDWREGPAPALPAARAQAPLKASWKMLPGMVRHVFTHFELQITVAAGSARGPAHGAWTPFDKLGGEALPSIMRKIIRHAVAALAREGGRS